MKRVTVFSNIINAAFRTLVLLSSGGLAVIALAFSLLFIYKSFPDEINILCNMISSIGTALSAGCAWLALSSTKKLIQEKNGSTKPRSSSEKINSNAI